MARHWQRKPLLVRGAIAGMLPLVPRSRLFEWAASDEVESRLVSHDRGHWRLQRGPLKRRAIPPLNQGGWTLLLQGMDLHEPRVHALMQQFRFVPEARLDDLMISYASDGGGVGPHFDSYDVFLLQAQGRRRWRVGRQRDLSVRSDLPLKILASFEPEHEWVLEPGDMLYLPPRWAHDGVAEGECQTYSIGFRSPTRGELARELLQRAADDAWDIAGDAIYRDPAQAASDSPGRIPDGMQAFAMDAVAAALREPQLMQRVLGEYLSEPKPQVWFESQSAPSLWRGVVLDARTRMLYDDRHIFINGESVRARGRDARLMRRLADDRRLGADEVAGSSPAGLELLVSWCEVGWLHEGPSE